MKKIIAITLLITAFLVVGCGGARPQERQAVASTDGVKILSDSGSKIATAHYWTDPRSGKKFIIFEGKSSEYPISAVELK